MSVTGGLCIGGGNCELCGRCNLFDTTTRKKKLTNLPEGFVPEPFDDKEYSETTYGVAFDIGTTTVVGMLWDLNQSRMVDSIAKTNPQGKYGADVISRITYASSSDENLNRIHQAIILCLNEMMDTFSKQYSFKRDQIHRITIVGNTTMGHLLLGIDPSSLARAPFEPAYEGAVTKNAEEMKLNCNPSAIVHVLPNIAGHVGADIVGMILAADLQNQKGLILAIDVGTNGEIVLCKDGKMLSCSTAAGPAFEGARIYHGMRASNGAIENVKINKNAVTLKVIGNTVPIGICGSGLIDVMAQLFNNGIINFRGNLITRDTAESEGFAPAMLNRFRKKENGNEFVLHFGDDGKDIVINQKDIREVQLAKGAIWAGVQVLLHSLESSTKEIDRVLLAGAFGSYIDKNSALDIGLLPAVSVEKVEHIGNAAGVGSCMALLSSAVRKQGDFIAQSVGHVELASHPKFEKEYLLGMYFPETTAGDC